MHLFLLQEMGNTNVIFVIFWSSFISSSPEAMLTTNSVRFVNQDIKLLSEMSQKAVQSFDAGLIGNLEIQNSSAQIRNSVKSKEKISTAKESDNKEVIGYPMKTSIISTSQMSLSKETAVQSFDAVLNGNFEPQFWPNSNSVKSKEKISTARKSVNKEVSRYQLEKSTISTSQMSPNFLEPIVVAPTLSEKDRPVSISIWGEVIQPGQKQNEINDVYQPEGDAEVELDTPQSPMGKSFTFYTLFAFVTCALLVQLVLHRMSSKTKYKYTCNAKSV